MRLGALLMASVLGSASVAQAGSLRCGGRLVKEGDSTAEVQMKCGEPTTRDRRIELFDGAWSSVTIDEWTYNLGPNDFVRILTFVNGILRRIETGEYGK
jgi:hypothetical protein